GNESAYIGLQSIVETPEGQIWIGTGFGLLVLEDTASQNACTLIHGSPEPSKFELTSSHISKLFVDQSGVLWIGSFGGGVNYLDLKQKAFFLLQRQANHSNTLAGEFVRAIQEDQDGNIYIGTKVNGLDYFDFQTGKFQHYEADKGNPQALLSNNIRSMMMSSDEKLWIGTAQGISILDPTDNSFTNLPFRIGQESSASNDQIFGLQEDAFGQIWTGSWNRGVQCYRPNPDLPLGYEIVSLRLEAEPPLRLASNRVTFIQTDSLRPEVLIATDQGLHRVFLDQEGAIQKIVHYRSDQAGEDRLSSNFIWPIVRQNDSVAWLGTLGGGLNRLVFQDTREQHAYKSQHYSLAEGAPSQDIESLEMDPNGMLWLGGKGLAMFNPESEQFTLFDLDDGLQSNSFKIGASEHGASGRLYFGGTNGLNYFYPDSIKTANRQTGIVLTELNVNNQVVHLDPKDHKSILPHSLSETNSIRLSHLQNNFSLSFSALHYINPNNCKYRYMLEGYDKDWVVIDADNRQASYSNLDYGNYTFLVASDNGNGVWSKKLRRLDIEIIAPWYETILARSLFVLLIFLIVGAVLYYVANWYNLKRAYE
ncbi:MAG: two-component regulator propeller domain-containing protein, partial [Bacteroidota bacterium]